MGLFNQVADFLSSTFFSESQPDPHRPKSEIAWLNREYANILRNQPAAKVQNLRNYYFNYRVPKGRFRNRTFPLHIQVKSPYDPPTIYCSRTHNHPNFFPSGRLCIKTPWRPFGSIFEYLERTKHVIVNPNYRSPAR